ncbi:MAG TPA: cell division protein ZapA [Candidatus Acidoferrales bacterium]|nr:cell division protein ZapA [Candidatus Acidoferrales bacterium]
MKKPVEVEIMGHKFTVSSDADDSYVRSVAVYVDEKAQEIVKTSRPVANFNVAMLAALNIADELYRLKERHEAMLKRLNRLSERISMTLGEEVSGNQNQG